VVFPGLEIHSFGDGARNTDRQAKFIEDAKLGEDELAELTQDDPRYPRVLFYAASSHHCAHNYERAKELYAQRVRLEGYRDEVFISLLRLADIARIQGVSEPIVLMGYLQAYDFDPCRAEPLVAIATMFRHSGQGRDAWRSVASIFYGAAGTRARPLGKLFVQTGTYSWE
jgi:hypothetical protein